MQQTVSFFVRIFLTACLALAIPAGAASATTSDWSETEHTRLRLISTADSLAGGNDRPGLLLGLQFELQPSWKIYWRSPGDAGYPPSIDWSGSENLRSAELMWPVPHRFSLFGLETFGYSDEVVLPIRAQVEDPGRPLDLTAKVSYLTCSEICIPYEARLALTLPPEGGGRAPQAFFIESAMANVPGHGAEEGLSVESVRLAGDMEAPKLEVAARADPAFQSPDVLVEVPPGFVLGPPEVNLSEEGRNGRFIVPVAAGPEGQVLEGKRLTVTVTDGNRGIEHDTVARFAAREPAGLAEGLLAILPLALLGGLILNLMPCVLPVLSLKLLSVVKHGGGGASAVRVGFLASAAGIVFSFLLLAGAALAARSAGMAVGWGIQFQQPLFLAFMLVVLTFFACNLLGFFEIPLPRWSGTVSAGAEAPGLTGSFLTGAFATLLATPCSAPFLGTAVGFALSAGAAEIVAVFLALGVGMATPYLLVALVPAAVRWLPRPGPWMVILKRGLALALAATAAWLLDVLAGQIGTVATLAATALLLGLAGLLWTFTRIRRGAKGWALRGAAVGLALALLVGAGAWPPEEPAARDDGEVAWQRLEQERIPDLVEAGHVVFVDITADWCVTCQVNKRLAINRSEVEAWLRKDAVVAMQGDWTRPDPGISAYLESVGRYGIPFNAVYGPGAPEGVLLPELLSAAQVLDALTTAAGSDGLAMKGP